MVDNRIGIIGLLFVGLFFSFYSAADELDEQYFGCYQDNVTVPDLEKEIHLDSMTISLCIEQCRNHNKTYAGAQDGSKCFCGDTYGKYGHSQECKVNCIGDASYYCGGNLQNSIYSVCPVSRYGKSCERECHCFKGAPCNLVNGSCPTGCAPGWSGAMCNGTNVPASGLSHYGCFNDARNNSFIQIYENSSLMTIQLCMDRCRAEFGLGLYVGLQIGRQCFCGNSSYSSNGTSNKCENHCVGSPSDRCGGPWANDVYSTCQDGYYGVLCSHQCHCFQGLNCTIEDGTCPASGCSEGWMGTSCNVRNCTVNNGNCTGGNETCTYEKTGEGAERVVPRCRCKEGYTRNWDYEDCKDIDECTLTWPSNLCNSKFGDCVNLEGSYNCTCKTGFQNNGSKVCEEDPCNLSTGLTTDPTVSSTTDDPCTTINTEVETTTVETTAQPTTPTTTQPLDLCNSSPCRNGATCMDVGNTFNCTCVPGFTGTICDVEINECETNPCYPFGKCTDLIGDYNCTCNPGYEANDTKSCIETNFCALESEPCENGGTCVNQNALNRYFCLCPVLNDKQYVGLHCETVLVTSPIVHGGISPTSGIIAGGASVTIRGQGLDLFEPLGAYLIDTPTTGTPKPTLYAYVIPNLTLSDSIAVQIPPADIAYVDLDLLVIVEYTGPINVTSDTENLRFKYTGNPVITTIEPKEILVSGGVHLTISGSNMDTVQNPVMEITTFVVNKTAGNSEKNFSREICSLRNTSTITCLIPQGIVPSSFINDTESVGKSLPGVAHLESLFRHKRGRRTKRAPVANLTDDTGNTFEMYLGFIFDQYPTYNNISKSLPHVTLSFVQPKISFKPGVSMDFVSNKQDIISLYGSGFTHGCSMDDYQVNISDAPCIVNSLTDNELQCRPPKEEPKISDDSMHCEFDQHPVMVHVGDMSYLGCCVSYTTDYTDLIIGVTVICVVVVAIIILVAVLVYKRHKNQRKGKGSDDDSIIAHKPIGVMSPTPAHVHTQSDDYDDVITSDVSNVDVSLANQTTVVEIRSGTSRADIDYLSPRASQVEFNSNDIRGDRNGRTRDSHAQVYRDRDFLDNAKLGDRPISEPAIDYLIEDDPDY